MIQNIEKRNIKILQKSGVQIKLFPPKIGRIIPKKILGYSLQKLHVTDLCILSSIAINEKIEALYYSALYLSF